MERNPTVRFLLIGDQRPRVHRWPTNARFFKLSLRSALMRARQKLGVAPAEGLSLRGGGSKISDFKPMLAHLFPEKLAGCDFWGYLQEDQLLGDLRYACVRACVPSLLARAPSLSPHLMPHA